MAKAKNSFVGSELDWAEAQLKTWKEYVDTNPMGKLKDRVDTKGRTIATKEVQGKYLQETMKNYLALTDVVDKLREQKEMKDQKIRGGEDLSPLENGEI
jgi:hypothetical protein